MRILILDPYPDGGTGSLDVAWRAQRAGHEVKFFQRRGPKNELVGRDLVDCVSDYAPWLKWADLIFNADNTSYLDILEREKEEGQLVISGNKETSSWELDREKGMKIFESHGIAVPPYRQFDDYDDAISYVKKEMKRFVSKPCGDVDKALTYVSKSPQDMVFMLEKWKRMGKLKCPFILQEFVGGIEMAVGGWCGPNGFIEGWCENFEFKKLMAGDLGVACYSDDTEVLTDSGWKFWPEVHQDDLLASLSNGKLIFEKPSALIEKTINEEMIGWCGPAVDILVTQTHNMYVQDDHARKDYFLEPANETETNRRFALRGCAEWEGEERGVSADYAALVGIYIADGSLRQRSVVFGNCPPHKVEKFTEIARRAGYDARLYGPDLYINSADLVRSLTIYGRSHQKFVHPDIKASPPDVIDAFLNGYFSGDGHRNKNGTIYAETVSKRLADDIQELCLKMNRACSIQLRERDPNHKIKGVLPKSYRPSYVITVCSKNKRVLLCPEICYRTQYCGTVYCATVTSHILLVRRNGKAVWSGNTGEMGTVLAYTKKSKLAQKVLKPVEEAIAATGYCSYIDVNCIIDEKGNPWPLEFTTRPGWPTCNIQCALDTRDFVEWMMEFAEGRDPKQFRMDETAIGVVIAVPDFPYSHVTRKEVVGTPIYGLWDNTLENIHPVAVYVGKAPNQVGNTIVDRPTWQTAGDYVLVVTATGATVTAARNTVYRRVEQVELPSSPMWRIDIGKRLQKQLPDLQKHGYALGFRYN